MSLVESKSSNRQQRDKIHRRIRRRNLHSKACSWCTHGAMEEKRNRGLEYPFTLCVYKLPIPQYSFLCVYHGPIFILPKLNEVFLHDLPHPYIVLMKLRVYQKNIKPQSLTSKIIQNVIKKKALS